jgi:hypothetical protein
VPDSTPPRVAETLLFLVVVEGEHEVQPVAAFEGPVPARIAV